MFSLSGIGDALMFTPALKLLRQTYPDALIDALCMFRGVKDIYENNPDLSNVYYFDMMKEGALKTFLYMLKLRGKYDVSFNVYPSNRKEYNLLSFFTAARRRAGVKYIRENNKNLGFLNNITVEENDLLHNVETNVRLVSAITGKTADKIPGLQLPLTAGDEEFAGEYLAKKNIIADDLVIGFHPGCSTLKNHINRRWEPEKFSQLADLLSSRLNAKILVFGGPEEQELKDLVVSGAGTENISSVSAGSLSQSAAIMKRCDLFVTNDSSLMHVASALKLKVAAIIGPTNVHYIHPWKTDYRIVSLNLECSPCFFYSPKPLQCNRNDVLYKCVREITPEMVFEECRQFLSAE